MSGDRSKRTNTPSPDVLNREARVVALRRSRMPWADIATAAGYANAAGAQRAYRRAVARVLVATVDEARREEVDMLDRLHAAYWKPALEGDTVAAQLLVKISEQRGKYLGLHAALRVKAEVTEATRERARELVAHLRALPPVVESTAAGAESAPSAESA